MSEKRTALERYLPWTAGITIPLLIVVLSALWGVSNTMSALAVDNAVLETRTDYLERAIFDIKSSVDSISKSVSSLAITQSTHNALIEVKIDMLKSDLKARSEPILP